MITACTYSERGNSLRCVQQTVKQDNIFDCIFQRNTSLISDSIGERIRILKVKGTSSGIIRFQFHFIAVLLNIPDNVVIAFVCFRNLTVRIGLCCEPKTIRGNAGICSFENGGERIIILFSGFKLRDKYFCQYPLNRLITENKRIGIGNSCIFNAGNSRYCFAQHIMPTFRNIYIEGCNKIGTGNIIRILHNLESKWPERLNKPAFIHFTGYCINTGFANRPQVCAEISGMVCRSCFNESVANRPIYCSIFYGRRNCGIEAGKISLPVSINTFSYIIDRF